MGEVGRWFLGIFQQRISFPLDVELSAKSGALMGDNGFHGVFFFPVDFRRQRLEEVGAVFRGFPIGE